MPASMKEGDDCDSTSSTPGLCPSSWTHQLGIISLTPGKCPSSSSPDPGHTLLTPHLGFTSSTPQLGITLTTGLCPTSSTPQLGPTSLLPPCRVCEDSASGFHYGVNTCEACKGFFRRSMLRREKYKCLGAGDCDVKQGKRNGCPFCRYQRCLAVGMSKHAIKTGRYTHKKRTQDIIEVQHLRDGLSHVTEVERLQRRPQSPWQQKGNVAEKERLIEMIVECHGKYMQTFGISEDQLEKDQIAYYEQHKLKVDVFGPMPTLPKEQYDEIYQSTGIDIDNRQDMMKGFAITMEAAIRRYINFVKAIPGFTELSPDDQAVLIKTARFEFFFLGSFRGYNNKLKVLRTPSGKCLTLQEVCKLWDEDFILEVFNFADTLKSLKMSIDECILVKTLSILFRDRCELQNPEKVEEIQWKIVSALIHLIQKEHPKPMLRFAKIIDRLIAIRELTEWDNRVAKTLYLWPVIQESPLLLDMITM